MAMSFSTSTSTPVPAQSVAQASQLSQGDLIAVGFALTIAILALVGGELLIAFKGRSRSRSRLSGMHLRRH